MIKIQKGIWKQPVIHCRWSVLHSLMLTRSELEPREQRRKTCRLPEVDFFCWQLVGPEIHSLIHSSVETSAQRLFRKWLAAFIVLVYTLFKITCVICSHTSPYGLPWWLKMVNNPPAIRETWVQSLGWEEPLQEGMAIHSSILAWRTPWTKEPGGLYNPWGRKKSDTIEQLSTFHQDRKSVV